MKTKRVVKALVAVVVIGLLFQAASPLMLKAEPKTCAEAYEDCRRVAAVVGAIYHLFCLQGYAFCVRFLEN